MKRKVIIVITLIIILLLATSIYFLIKYYNNQKLLDKITNAYSPYVVTKKDKDIYLKEDDTYKKIGTIYKDSVVSLTKKEVENTTDIYYGIKGSNYYITYHDLEKESLYQSKELSHDSYTTKHLITNKANFYQAGKLKLSLRENLELPVLLIEDNKYYVPFLDDIYYIEDNYEIKELSNVDPLVDISVLNFSDDISELKLREVLEYLKENDYETITLEEFKLWVENKIELRKNSVLLLSYKELTNEKEEIVTNLSYTVNTDIEGIQFVSGDSKIKEKETKYYKYEVTSKTTVDRVKDMLNGIKEKKVLPNQVAVLNYHFFYDSSKGESCNESICLDVSNFRKQLDYLKENGFKTLTIKEFNDWMDKKITVPPKSVLITIDDGAMGTSKINGNQLIPILEEYEMHATLFLITGWWSKENYESEYLDIESHGDELHHNNYCDSNGCGYKTLRLSKEDLVKDLNLSVEKIGSNIAFCYPFYQKNNTLVEALKETGFKLAFVGGNKKVTTSTNRYQIPRYIIYKNTSLSSFKAMVNQ